VNINKRIVAAVAAVVLAALGIVSLVAYVNDADDRAFKGTQLVPVVRVVDDVPAGTATSDLGRRVEVVKLPKASVPDSALTSLDDVEGLVTNAPLVTGEVLVEARFGDTATQKTDDSGSGGKDGKGVAVPAGMQEVTIKVSSVRAVGGTIRAGDTVGVLASYESPLETNFAVNQVLVLDAKTVAGANADGATEDVQLRLAVMSIDAEKIVHAAEFGHIYLTKQGDDAKVDRRLVTVDGVLK
jgi:pilus assembly protein CpaB